MEVTRKRIEQVLVPMYGAAFKLAIGDNKETYKHQTKWFYIKLAEFMTVDAQLTLSVLQDARRSLEDRWPGKIKKAKIEGKYERAVNLFDPENPSRPVLLEAHKPQPKKDKVVLDRKRWRAVRFDAFLVYGSYCACCGDRPSNGAVLTVDHVKAKSHHPELMYDLRNLQILCVDCNETKGNWNKADFRTPIQRLKAVVAVKYPSTIKGY